KDGEKLKAFETKFAKKFGPGYKITLKEIRVPELSAKIIAEFAASQIEARMPYRKVGKSVLEKVMQKGATGVKIMIAGRLGGTDIARSEKFIEGRVSLQTFRADIDYHYTTAMTKYGIIGIKVWISKGEIFTKKGKAKSKEL
ncbi:MAG TPA: 30S ribosomal protein S3, partial [Candidatus Absconditabacterales bacterium]|nr:30S ribosomal protein S3 [Candidatus Absconditabacterales bacterium]